VSLWKTDLPTGYSIEADCSGGVCFEGVALCDKGRAGDGKRPGKGYAGDGKRLGKGYAGDGKRLGKGSAVKFDRKTLGKIVHAASDGPQKESRRGGPN